MWLKTSVFIALSCLVWAAVVQSYPQSQGAGQSQEPCGPPPSGPPPSGPPPPGALGGPCGPPPTGNPPSATTASSHK